MVTIGIDADTERLAVAWMSNGVVDHVETVRRKKEPSYIEQVRNLMKSARGLNAIVYLEDIFLAEARGRATARRRQCGVGRFSG